MCVCAFVVIGWFGWTGVTLTLTLTLTTGVMEKYVFADIGFDIGFMDVRLYGMDRVRVRVRIRIRIRVRIRVRVRVRVMMGARMLWSASDDGARDSRMGG